MSRRNVDSQTSIDGQLYPSNSFIYQLPDVVLKRNRDRKMPYVETFQGIILFADVSGFTEMCQKYSGNIQRGVNQLANALNDYMAPIVEAVLREKGDVYKFAGDAVLGLWPFENNSIEHKREQAKRVISCALYMKMTFCDYTTSTGTILNIKSAIAMGSYSIIFLRGSTPSCVKILDEYGVSVPSSSRNVNLYSQTSKKVYPKRNQSISRTSKLGFTEDLIERCRANLVNYYVCYGSAVVSVRNAEHQCRSQDIIIDMSTWLLLDSDSEYIYEKFTVEHNDEDVELSSRTSGHQAEFVGQIPSNTILASISKHLSPPLKSREVPSIRKIISHYIRLHGRRNDNPLADDLFDSQSIMSADSIEPTDHNNDILKKSQTLNQYSPVKTSLNQWNTPKTPLLETIEIDGKDLLTVSPMTSRKQELSNRRVDLTEEESFELRPSAFEEYDTFDLSTFIIKPVRNQESLDQLSELRLINICFISILLTDYQIKQLPFKLQTVIDCCAEQISITNGLLTKVIMFDKGLSLLCAFGLPGYKHSDDAERALKFAFLITQRLEKLNFVARVSAGVSTGQTFCGVLGHSLRCEYTVIGRKVNMAARLMVNYPGIVSCDDETYHKAHLDERYFELLPTVPLKGLIVSTSMRRYKGQEDDQNNMSVFIFPMINREDEWTMISELIEQVIEQKCHQFFCVFLTGSTGVGRSRLLAHINEELMYNTQNIRRVSYNASFENVQLFGYALKQLFKKLLYTELQESSAILRVLKSLLPNHEKSISLLRPYFDKLNVDVDKSSGVSKRKLLEEILRELLLNATNPNYEIFNYQPQPTIFLIDDAQYIDKESWQYLHLLGSASTSLLIMAMRDPASNDDELHTRMTTLRDSPTTKHIQLMGLDNRYLTTLACQAMFVQRIPKDLEILITRKSDKGHPQNVIQLLSDLLANQIIRIESITSHDEENHVEGIQEYLWKRLVRHDPTTGNVKVLFEYVEPQLCRICDPDRNKFWSYTNVIENINAHVKIDKLRDLEKRIAKISSLCTKNISKRMIVYAMTNYDTYTNEMLTVHQLNNNKHSMGINADLFKINSAFAQLYRAQIFECAWLDYEARKNPITARLIYEKNLTPICCCPENSSKQIENCRMYRFKDPTLKEATLATIIDQFQEDYSSKMALFIESKLHLCKSCNGDSDSLIFLTPIQSMKLGMSILNTFHQSKLKQLTQRLQSMIFNHLSRVRQSDPSHFDQFNRNNHSYSSTYNVNEILRRYLIRKSFKFRRKKSSIKSRRLSVNWNSNSRRSIETILYHQWGKSHEIGIPRTNNAIDDSTSFEDSPIEKNKRLLTKDMMFEAEQLIKHLHLSRDDEEDSLPNNPREISEYLNLNLTEICPLFLLKEGIDHRFEFLDFAPDLYIRQGFHPINENHFHFFTEHLPQTNEIEYNQRNCRCNYLLVEIYRLLIKFWNQSSNMEKVLYYSLELARIELIRTNYYESKILLENLLQLMDKENNSLNFPSFFEVQIYDLLSESIYRMRDNDTAFLYVVYGLKILDVQLIDIRSNNSLKLKSQCKELRHQLLRILIHPQTFLKYSDAELIEKYFQGKFLFRAGQCARRYGQLLFAYFCVLNASFFFIQCQTFLTNYEHCQALTLLVELSHDLKRTEDCDLFVQAILKFIESIEVGYETIAIKANWLAMSWNLYRANIDRALHHSYKIKDLLNKIGAYENLMSIATYSLQTAMIGRREEVIRDLMDIIDIESNRPFQYENRLWSLVLTLEAFVELNIDYDENLLNEIVHAIDYLLEHLEKKTSTPSDIQKFLTMVFYAQASLVECYTKINELDHAHQYYIRAIKFGMSLKEWTFRVCNGMLKLAFYEIYQCTRWLMERNWERIPEDIEQHLIVSHLNEISQYFQLLRPRYLMCLALKSLIGGNQRLAKSQFTHAVRRANDLQLHSERKFIELTRKQIFRIIIKRKMNSKRRKS